MTRVIFALVFVIFLVISWIAYMRSAAIHPSDADLMWIQLTKYLGFPTLYVGVEPILGVVINGALWAWAISATVRWIMRVGSHG